MRRRPNPGRTFRLRAVNTSPVGWLALERPRSNAEFLPESQRSIVRAEIEARLAAATTYEEHGQGARAAELRLGADALLAVLESRSEGD